ncbi:MAG: hypothetical protein BGO87_13255 [Flavobacteriia bacterium 40-80]|nr:MAG: hypothetical protein BGO87_13255 [Flavobacteriia bacterium 40-80]
MKTTSIFGYNFICDLNYDQISTLIINDIENNTIITNVITPNAHGIVSYDKFPEINKFCQQSKYILPDGQPLVWLSNLTQNKIAKRLTGSDLFPVLFNKVNNTKFNLLFILSTQDLADEFKLISINSTHYVPPHLSLEDTRNLKNEALIISQLIKKNNIDLVFFGISEPKQGIIAKYITDILEQEDYSKSCIMLFLGASYEFYFNLKERAPKIFQKLGLEWFYRLIREPRRLFKRYTITNFKFILKAIKWKMGKH